MARWFLVLSLIATLVLCPFRCGGAFAAACADESTAEARIEGAACGCDCCRTCPSASLADGPSQSDEPIAPLEEDCDCCDCVCEGAVLDSPEPAPVLDEGAGIVLFETTPPELVQVRVACSHDFWHELDPSGRTLRVLRQSFQI